MNSAPVLLLTGLFMGHTFPFGKLASGAGISPLVWTWLIASGLGVCLLFIRIISGKLIRTSRVYLKYYMLSCIVSLVIPNLLAFTVILKLGAGYTSLMVTLSAVFTAMLSSIWNVRMPDKPGLLGIVIGFVGAAVVALTRGEFGSPAHVG